MAVTSPGPHSCLIVEVPEAEPAVARPRERLDASASLGITVLDVPTGVFAARRAPDVV